MRSCDVLIVGGGPAGSTCAWRLRAGGLSVLLVDRAKFPRDKTCAGWITPAVVKDLDLNLKDYGSSRVLEPIHGFLVGVLGGKERFTEYGEVVSYGIRRCEFDDYLLRRSGVETVLGEGLRTIERVGDRWQINGEFEAKILIGAGGHFCPVGRWVRGDQPDGRTVVTAQEVEFESKETGTVQGGVPELYFCEDLKGYGWCFRKGNYLNIGLGRTSPTGLSEDVKEFADYLRSRGKVNGELPERWKGHAYCVYESVRPALSGEGVLLIGDAAGLAERHSGEGIRTAVESAIMAAEVVLESRGDYSKAGLAGYEKQVISRYGPPAKQGVQDWIPRGILEFVGRRLMGTGWFQRRVVLDQWFLNRG